MDINIEHILKKCSKAKSIISILSTKIKNDVLAKMAEELTASQKYIIEENKKDHEKAKQKGLSKVLLDRLLLNENRIKQMAKALTEIIHLPDPVGEIVSGSTRPNGLKIRQIRVPLGMILIIYEARPNVTTDAAGLCFKSGNVTILRGGSDSFRSNLAITEVLRKVLKGFNLPEEIITFIPAPEREVLMQLLKRNDYIDVLIPRGGSGLINMVVENSCIPVIYHADGVCHIYVDKTAEEKMCEKIVLNAKTQRPGVCNAIESLLIHKDYTHTDSLIEKLLKANVEIRGDNIIQKIDTRIRNVKEEDWTTEYLDLILSVKLVDNIDQAIQHINKYGSHHSDAIITTDYANSEKFLNEIDSTSVYVNASTRFTDGGEFGLGAEVGISTQKLHSRGPMGLRDLTSKKFIIYGEGQIRE